MQTYAIQRMRPGDWEQVRTIYLEGIATGDATFEAEAPAWEQWDAGHLAEKRFVACTENNVIGCASLSPVSSRCVYEGVEEVSIYVSQSRRGQGVGAALLNAPIKESEEQGFWTLQASLFPENMASLALHRRHGFREIGKRERIGKMNGIWRDTVFLERRSSIVGV